MKKPPDTELSPDLVGREVLVAICGGIAAYKVCYVVSELVQRGAGVTVVMTEAAARLVTPTTFEALSGRDVLRSIWNSQSPAAMPHITVTESADLVLVAPATANMIGKIAAGIADDLVSTMILSAASPVVLAPAMNERMWANRAVQENAATLTRRGLILVGPGEGWMACGSVGRGRMVEPHEIIEAITPILKERKPRRQAQEPCATQPPGL